MLAEGDRVIHKTTGWTGTLLELQGRWSPKNGKLFWMAKVEWDKESSSPKPRSSVVLNSLKEADE